MLPLHRICLSLIWILQPSFSAAQLVSHSPAHRSTSLDFGRCGDPGIVYDYGLDGSNFYGYAPENQTQFPHGYSADIASLEVYICDRLQGDCGASHDAVQACVSAFENYSGLSGQQGADTWNSALGLYGTGPMSETTTTTVVTTTVAYTGNSGWYSYSSSPTTSHYPLSESSPTRTITSTETLIPGSSSSSSRSGTGEESFTSSTITSTSTTFVPKSTTSSSTGTSLIVPTFGPTTVTTTTASLSTADVPSQSSSTDAANTNGSPFSMQSGMSKDQIPRIFLLAVFTSSFLALMIR